MAQDLEVFHAFEFMLSESQSRKVKSVAESMVADLSSSNKRQASSSSGGQKAKKQREVKATDTMSLFG